MTRASSRSAAKRELYSGGWAMPLQDGRYRELWSVFRTYSEGAQRVFTAAFRARGRATRRRRI